MSKHLEVAHRVIKHEAKALEILKEHLPEDFDSVIEFIINFKGRIILTGIGKSGYIAHKIAASFASTGTAAFYIHPAEASHGDLGMITKDDLVVMLSTSGNTKELLDIINYCKRFNIKILGITMSASSFLSKASDYLFLLPKYKEASSIQAPTTSALMMLSIGDALTIAVQEAKGFCAKNFRIFHPGGKIGTDLSLVRDVMHSGWDLPLVRPETSFKDTIIEMNKKRLGCAIVVDDKMQLLGIITDGDLRRHIYDDISSNSAKDVMSKKPRSIEPEKLVSEALYLMQSQIITALTVVENYKIVGLIKIHDLIKLGFV